MPSTYTTSSGITLARDAFIAHYVAAWLGSWASNPARSNHQWLSAWAFVHPWEKAMRCAEAAWAELEVQAP